MELQNLLQTGANVQLVINGNDLMDFAEALIGKTIKQQEKKREAGYTGETMTAEHVSVYLNISHQTLWRYRKQGLIKAHKKGARVFFRKKEIEKVLCGGQLYRHGRYK